MTLRQLIPLNCCLLLLATLAGCGNKGDLSLIPDPVSQQDIDEFQRVLEVDEIPVAPPLEVDDDNVYKKSQKSQSSQSEPDVDSSTVN